MRYLLLVALAGAVGTTLRFLLMRSLNGLIAGFPWGTLAVNVAGSFAAGFLFLVCRQMLPHYSEYFPILFIGFFGAFTTFSTFALESSRYLLDAQYVKFGANLLLQNVFGIAAAAGGLLLARVCLR